MAKQICQSCSMPIIKDDLKGTETDGSKSQKYCIYCYENGGFTAPNMTMEQMQGLVVEKLKEKHWPGFLAKLATKQIPKLERWQKA